MISRRVFLKNGGVRARQPRLRAVVPRADRQRAADGRGGQAAHRDLPARRGGRPERRRARSASATTIARGRRIAIARPGTGDAARSISTASSASTRGSRRSSRCGTTAQLADRPRVRIARRDALALRRAGLHGNRHAGREEHARRLAEPLSATRDERPTRADAVPRGGADAAAAAHAAGHGAGAGDEPDRPVRHPRRQRPTWARRSKRSTRRPPTACSAAPGARRSTR